MTENKKKKSTSLWVINFLHPRYWLPLISVTLLWLATRLPYSVQMNMGSVLGRVLYYVMPWRRIVAQTNVRLVYPELSEKENTKFVKQNFRFMGKSLFEASLGWWADSDYLKTLCQIEGLDNLQNAMAQGKGVILLSAHFTCLEIGARLISIYQPINVTYKSSKNPLYEAMLKGCREKNFNLAIQRHDVRAFINSLKQNNVVWYAPDQDFGVRHSVFAPFMGINTATLTATSRFAKISGALVVPFFPQQLDNNKGYKLSLLPALDGFPSGDDEVDAIRINNLIEEQVKKIPQQYLWVHCRFKTRPEGEPPVYPVRRK